MMKCPSEQRQLSNPAGGAPSAEQLQAAASSLLRRVAQQLGDQLLADAAATQAKAERPR
jgi:hypothetical protein